MQQKLTDIPDDKIQLMVSLQKKECKCVPDETMSEELTNNQRLCIHYAGELKAVKKISQAKAAELDKLQSE